MNGVVLAKRINSLEPLNRFRKPKEIEEKIFVLNVQERINLLVFSFKNYDKNYNKSLCLTYPNLWNEFNENNWKDLIIEMFPKETDVIKNDLRIINTGKYFGIFLLNAIIGISPFRFIFNELIINNDEKKSFFYFLKFYGEIYFFYNERELIEDVVNFYELGIFSDIIKMKEKLIKSIYFEESISYLELLNQFKYLE